MATFCSMPCEIRVEIYSYLLKMANLRTPDESRDKHNMEASSEDKQDHTDKSKDNHEDTLATPLFRVNKQISSEALDYFYVTHAFSIVDFHLCLQIFNEDLKQILPQSIVIPNEKATLAWKLSHVNDERFIFYLSSSYEGPFCDSVSVTLVTPARELGLLMRILNRQHKGHFSYGKLHTELVLFPHLDSPWFVDKDKLKAEVLKSLKLLRNPCGGRYRNQFRFQVVSRGDQSAAQFENWSIPSYCDDEMLRYCQTRMIVARNLLHNKDYDSVMNEHLAIDILTERFHNEEFDSRAGKILFTQMQIERDLTQSVCSLESERPCSHYGEEVCSAGHIAAAVTGMQELGFLLRSLSGENSSAYAGLLELLPEDMCEKPLALIQNSVPNWRLHKYWTTRNYHHTCRNVVKALTAMDALNHEFQGKLPDILEQLGISGGV